MLGEFHDPIAYDLRRYCGLSIQEFWAGRISPRELLALILQLPAEGGAFHRAIEAAREKAAETDLSEREARYIAHQQRRAEQLAAMDGGQHV